MQLSLVVFLVGWFGVWFFYFFYFSRWNSLLTRFHCLHCSILLWTFFFTSDNRKENRECFAEPGELYKCETWSLFPHHHCIPITWGLSSRLSGYCHSPAQRRRTLLRCHPNRHKPFAWVLQPDVLQRYPSKELMNFFPMEDRGELKKATEIAPKYVLRCIEMEDEKEHCNFLFFFFKLF